MSLRIVVRPAATRDIEDAYAWYEQQREGLGRAFLQALDLSLERITSGPERYPIITGDARRGLLRGFPYSIYFRLTGDEIRILGVIHQSRNPRIWQKRVGERGS